MKKAGLIMCLVFFAVASSGCANIFATRYWYQADKSLEECQQDWRECDNRAKETVSSKWMFYRGNYGNQWSDRVGLRSQYMVARGYRFLPKQQLPEEVRRAQEPSVKCAGR